MSLSPPVRPIRFKNTNRFFFHLQIQYIKNDI